MEEKKGIVKILVLIFVVLFFFWTANTFSFPCLRCLKGKKAFFLCMYS